MVRNEGVSDTVQGMKRWAVNRDRAICITVPEPALTPGNVLVQVHAVSLISSDVPLAGRAFAGTVLQTFEDSLWQVGQKVWGRADSGNALSEIVAVPEWAIYKMKTNLTFEEASTLAGPGIMACKALQMASLPGEGKPKVLIHGANTALGVFAIQAARVLKCSVEGTAPAELRDQCRDLGVAEFVDLLDNIGKGEQLASFRGRHARNFHLVIDTLSNDVSIYDNLEKFTHEGAKYITTKPESVSWAASIKRRFSGSPREYAYLDGTVKKEDAAKWFQLVTRLINSPEFIAIEIEDEYSFEDVEAAMKAVEASRGFGCVVVEVTDFNSEAFQTALAKNKFAGPMKPNDNEQRNEPEKRRRSFSLGSSTSSSRRSSKT